MIKAHEHGALKWGSWTPFSSKCTHPPPTAPIHTSCVAPAAKHTNILPSILFAIWILLAAKSALSPLGSPPCHFQGYHPMETLCFFWNEATTSSCLLAWEDWQQECWRRWGWLGQCCWELVPGEDHDSLRGTVPKILTPQGKAGSRSHPRVYRVRAGRSFSTPQDWCLVSQVTSDSRSVCFCQMSVAKNSKTEEWQLMPLSWSPCLPTTPSQIHFSRIWLWWRERGAVPSLESWADLQSFLLYSRHQDVSPQQLQPFVICTWPAFQIFILSTLWHATVSPNELLLTTQSWAFHISAAALLSAGILDFLYSFYQLLPNSILRDGYQEVNKF